MLDAVKRYATKVLLLHLVLLGVVIFGVVVGTRQVYMGARKQAQEESAARLRLIGQQTAAAIETQYQSIASDMEILLRDTSAATQPATEPAGMGGGLASSGATTRPALGRGQLARQGGRNGRGGIFGFGNVGGIPVTANMVNDMWRQLQGRISQLFMVDNQTGEVVLSLPEDKKDLAQALTSAHLDWFKSLKAASMSAFTKSGGTDDTSGYHLLAIPTIERGRGGGRGFGFPEAASRPGAGAADVPGMDAGQGNRGGGGRGGANGLYGRGGRQGGRGFGGRGGGPGPEGVGFGQPQGPDGPDGPPPEGFGPPGGGRPDRGSGGLEGRGPEEGGGPGGMPGGPGPYGGGPGENGGAPAGPQTGTVVAVVSLDKVRADFFDPLNRQRTADVEAGAESNEAMGSGVVNAMLVDQKGDVLVSISGRWVGSNMLNDLNPEMRDAVGPLIREGKAGSYVMQRDASIGGMTLPARIIGFEPVDLPSGQKWTVMTMSPVSDADALVNRVFGSAFQWAVFVSVAVAGILFSTSVFMIRARVRLERAQHEVLTRELHQARNIQLAWLPGENETPAGIDVSAVNLPASHISGDFYNWFALDGPGKGKVAVVIGDVTGHGMAAAFLMATTQLLVKVALQRTQDPGACLGIVNKQLCTQGFSGQFVTMIVVVLEPGSGAVEVATAGHPAPLLQRDGVFTSMEVEPSLVLGVDAEETYKTRGFVAEAGATMILYTDGVVEAECDTGEQYGLDRLVTAVNRNGGPKTAQTGRPDQRIKAIVEDVKKFCGTKDLLDDLTVVAVRVG